MVNPSFGGLRTTERVGVRWGGDADKPDSEEGGREVGGDSGVSVQAHHLRVLQPGLGKLMQRRGHGSRKQQRLFASNTNTASDFTHKTVPVAVFRKVVTQQYYITRCSHKRQNTS